jgi:hypothetical protein
VHAQFIQHPNLTRCVPENNEAFAEQSRPQGFAI